MSTSYSSVQRLASIRSAAAAAVAAAGACVGASDAGVRLHRRCYCSAVAAVVAAAAAAAAGASFRMREHEGLRKSAEGEGEMGKTRASERASEKRAE